jgi:hypothetical protein
LDKVDNHAIDDAIEGVVCDPVRPAQFGLLRHGIEDLNNLCMVLAWQLEEPGGDARVEFFVEVGRGFESVASRAWQQQHAEKAAKDADDDEDEEEAPTNSNVTEQQQMQRERPVAASSMLDEDEHDLDIRVTQKYESG